MGLVESCSASSAGEPEFLAGGPKHISARAPGNLVVSANGRLQLYFESWKSDRHDHVRAAVFIHPSEMEHCTWYNGLAVRLNNVGCFVSAMDAQGFGQSDGWRGYFEHFEDVVDDFVEFVKAEWTRVMAEQPKGTRIPGFVLVGKGMGALVIMKGLVELQSFVEEIGVSPVVVLVSPSFQFASSVTEAQMGCGLKGGGRCGHAAPSEPPALGAAVEETPQQALAHVSWWFPKMIVTPTIDPDTISRDPAVVDRMNRDNLCWHQGYRARVLNELLREQHDLPDLIVEHQEIFANTPALMLHGSSDRLYAVQGCHTTHSAWCDAAAGRGTYPRMKIYDGAYHMLLNEPNKEEVLNDIVLFIVNKAIGT